MLPRLVLNSWAQAILLPSPPKVVDYRYELLRPILETCVFKNKFLEIALPFLCHPSIIPYVFCIVILYLLYFTFLETESCSVPYTGLQWHNHSSLQPQTPRLKPSSCQSLLST